LTRKSKNRKAPFLQKVENLTNYSTPKMSRFAELICGPPTIGKIMNLAQAQHRPAISYYPSALFTYFLEGTELMPAFLGTAIFLVCEYVIESIPFLTSSVMSRLVVMQNQATLGLVD
jgi:hypothetical protein